MSRLLSVSAASSMIAPLGIETLGRNLPERHVVWRGGLFD